MIIPPHPEQNKIKTIMARIHSTKPSLMDYKVIMAILYYLAEESLPPPHPPFIAST